MTNHESTRPTVLSGWKGFLRNIPDGQSMEAEMWRGRHRKILLGLAAHLPFLAALGLFSGTMPVTEAVIPTTPLWVVASELTLCGAVIAAAWSDRFRRRVRTLLSATGWMLASMMLVQFSGGYIEAHFHFFVAVGVLASYEDWLPFAVGISYVVLGHGAFATILDASRVYNHTAGASNPWVWGVIHGLFVSMLAVSELSNWQSIEQSRREAQEQLAEVERQRDLVADAEAAQAKAERREEEIAALKQDIETTAEQYQRTISRVADGDLTVRLDPSTNNDAMQAVGTAVNEMLTEMDDTVMQVQSFADQVADASSSATTAATTVESTSERVGTTIDTVDEQVTDQRDQLVEVASEMNTLSATIEEVASSASEVETTATEMAATTDEGRDAIEAAISEAQGVQKAVTAAVEAIEMLEGRMDEIGEITALIDDIADQTNLLALNANIEAARADTDGSAGFSVVADEVKQLAEETQTAASEIDELIGQAQAQTETVTETARRAATHADKAEGVVTEAGDQFDTLASQAETTKSGVSEISRATDDQAASTEETVSIVDQVQQMSEKTVTTADKIATAATRQTDDAQAIVGEVKNLATQAETLQGSLSTFTTSGTTSASETDLRERTTAHPGGVGSR